MSEWIAGGVTAPAGFRAAGVASGIKRRGLDLALLVADASSTAAAVFTRNTVVAAPIVVSRVGLSRSGGRARAIVANSGCANACTGAHGVAVAERMAEATAAAIGCRQDEVLVASTGVIGVQLDSSTVTRGIEAAARALATTGHTAAAEAILTTDRGPKEVAIEVNTSDGAFRVGGMAKGAGMIEPRLATMLAFLTTDCTIEPALLQRCLDEAIADTFNAITVDGECSTNDSVFALASGAAGFQVTARNLDLLSGALRQVCQSLATAIVRGGEGATKLITVQVTGAATTAEARQVARTIANSLLVKTAIHGGDPNWGRLLAAAGRSGVAVDPATARVTIGPTVLFAGGQPHDDRAAEAAAYLQASEVEVAVDLGVSPGHAATMWTCDLSADYVRINADYRT